MTDKNVQLPADAGEPVSVPNVQNDGWMPDEATCYAHRQSFRDPEHMHVCTAPAGHRYDDGHVCPCGDWWHG